jgi:predicted Zn finger-like uncharacterized protein
VQIVCPHCTTAYAIDMATLGTAGRTVRCSRCKEVWLARPEDAMSMPAMADGTYESTDPGAEWDQLSREDSGYDTPIVESPPIAGDWQDGSSSRDANWDTPEDEGRSARAGWLRNLVKRPARSATPRRTRVRSIAMLPVACTAMAALGMALIVWRADIVRLLPQTADFYRLVGLDVNLRGLAFKDVKVATETVEGTQVLVIQGTIVSETRKPADLPRLRFSVRDAQGAEIYAWNSVLERTVLKPGERASFKSRLASPPAEGRSIDIRFFNKHDIAGGSV